MDEDSDDNGHLEERPKEVNDTPMNGASINDMQTGQANNRVRVYPVSHAGPYEVFIREINAPISYVWITRKLLSIFTERDFVEIKKHSKGKIRAVFRTLENANKAVMEKLLPGFRMYIPSKSVEVYGVIKIDVAEDIKEISKSGVGKFKQPLMGAAKILDVYQMYRNVKEIDGTVNKTLSRSVKVTFAGSILPHWVEVNHCLIPVRIFNPIIMVCNKCKGFHHTSKYCKAKCLVCKSEHKNNECLLTDKECPHCNSFHNDIRECPKFKEKKLKLVKANSNKLKMSYAEALAPPVLIQNPYEALATPSTSSGSNNLIKMKIPFNFSNINSYAIRRKRNVREMKGTDENLLKKEAVKKKRMDGNTQNDGPRVPQGLQADQEEISPVHNQKKKKKKRKKTEDPSEETDSPRVPPGFRADQGSKVVSSVKAILESLNISPLWRTILDAIVLPLLEKMLPIVSKWFSSGLPFLIAQLNSTNV
jgi:hypothetical protein